MTRTFFRRCTPPFLAAVAVFAPAQAAVAADAPYPVRPVRLLIGFPPGGGLDAVGRIVAPKLSEAMGHNWVIDNRSGAGGNVAAELVARSAPDGHTLLLALSTQLTVNPSLYKLPFDVVRDFQPVTILNTAEHMLIVHPSVQATTLAEFLALARQKPGALRYASAGIGSSLHMAGELLKNRAGIDMTHVPYKGAGPAVAALLGGETQVLTGTTSSTIQHVKSGRLRALASLGARRSRVLPELPTLAESGYPGFEAGAWYGLLLPAGTPRSVVDRIRDEAHKAIAMPDVQGALAKQGLDPETTSSEQMGARIRAEIQQWAEVIRKAGIQAQ